jgi:hypothetical protein
MKATLGIGAFDFGCPSVFAFFSTLAGLTPLGADSPLQERKSA